MKKKGMLIIVLFAVAVAAWLLMRGDSDKVNEPRTDGKHSRSEAKKHRRKLAMRSSGGNATARKALDAAIEKIADRRGRSFIRITHSDDIESTWIYEDGTPWPEQQKMLMREIVNASEEGDFAAVAALANEVAKCDNPDLREQYVDELGWFGEQALVDLAPFISDPDDDVAESARSQLSSAFQEIESDTEKAAVYTLMARAVADSEVLEMFSDELFAMDEVIALQAIVDTLGDGTPKAQEAAKEAYKMITDEDWVDVDVAEAWLQKNYIADDDDDDSPKGDGSPKGEGTSNDAGNVDSGESGVASENNGGGDDEN